MQRVVGRRFKLSPTRLPTLVALSFLKVPGFGSETPQNKTAKLHEYTERGAHFKRLESLSFDCPFPLSPLKRVGVSLLKPA